MFYFFFFLIIRVCILFFFFFSSRRRHTRLQGDWSSDVCSSDLKVGDGSKGGGAAPLAGHMLEPLANDMRLRDLASARFRFNVRHQWLRQSYGETLHEATVLHLRQMCKTTERNRKV